MISAGDAPKVERFDRRPDTVTRVCGGWADALTVNRNKKCDTDLQTRLNGVSEQPTTMTDLQLFNFSHYLLAGAGTALYQCGFQKGKATKATAQPIVACSEKLVLNDGEIMFAGKKMKFVSEFLPFAAQKAREGVAINPEDIDVTIPEVLQKYIDSIDVGNLKDNNFFKGEAKRLFRNAIARIPDIGEKFDSRDKIGEQVKGEVEEHVKKFKAAGNDQERGAVKDGLVTTVVLSVGPKADYPVKFGQVPAALIPPGTPQPLANALRELYAQAVPIFIKNNGDVDTSGKVDPSLAQKLKKVVDDKGPKDPDDRTAWLRSGVSVKDVKVGPDKKATAVELQAPAGVGGKVPPGVGHAPVELYNRLDAGTDDARKTAIDYVWEQVTTILNNKKVKLTADLEGKLVERLAPADKQAGPNNLYNRSALDIGRQTVFNLEPMTLEPAPANAFNATEDQIKRRGSGASLATPSTGETELVIRIHRHYIKLLKEAQKNNVAPKDVAGILGGSIAPLIHPGMPGEPDPRGDKRLQYFMNHDPKYKKVGDKVVIDWVDTTGNGGVPTGDGVSFGDPNGVHGKVDLSGEVAGLYRGGDNTPSAPDAKPGSDRMGMMIYGDMGLKLYFNSDERFYLTPIMASWLTFIGPQMDTTGVAMGSESFGINEAHSTKINRVGNFHTGIGYVFYKGDDKSKADVGLTAGFHGNSRIQDASLASGFDSHKNLPTLDARSSPILGYNAIGIGGGTPILGGIVSLTYKQAPIKGPYSEEHPGAEVKVRGGYGAAKTVLSPTENDNRGSRYLVDASGALEVCRGSTVECSVMGALGVSGANGNAPAVGDTPAQPDAYKSQIFFASAAFLIQPTDHFRAMLQLRHANMNYATAYDNTRTTLGLGVEFPFVNNTVMPFGRFAHAWNKCGEDNIQYANTSGGTGKADDNTSGPTRGTRADGKNNLDCGSKMLELSAGAVFVPFPFMNVIVTGFYGEGTPDMTGASSRKSYGGRTGLSFSF